MHRGWKTCEHDASRDLKICRARNLRFTPPYITRYVTFGDKENNFVSFRFDSAKLCIVRWSSGRLSSPRTPKKRACSAIDQEPWSSSTSRHFSPSLGRPWRPHALSLNLSSPGRGNACRSIPEDRPLNVYAFTPTSPPPRVPDIGAKMTRESRTSFRTFPPREDEDPAPCWCSRLSESAEILRGISVREYRRRCYSGEQDIRSVMTVPRRFDLKSHRKELSGMLSGHCYWEEVFLNMHRALRALYLRNHSGYLKTAVWEFHLFKFTCARTQDSTECTYILLQVPSVDNLEIRSYDHSKILVVYKFIWFISQNWKKNK